MIKFHLINTVNIYQSKTVIYLSYYYQFSIADVVVIKKNNIAMYFFPKDIQ